MDNSPAVDVRATALRAGVVREGDPQLHDPTFVPNAIAQLTTTGSTRPWQNDPIPSDCRDLDPPSHGLRRR